MDHINVAPGLVHPPLIRPHSATERRHVGRAVRVTTFARGRPVNVSRRDNGDVIVWQGKAGTPNYRFIEGEPVR